MNIPMIDYIMRKCEELGKLPSAFYVVTNGKQNVLDLAITMLKWYGKMEEPDMCGLALSSDKFHEEPMKDEVCVLKGLSFFRPEDKAQDPNHDRWILNSGNALENGIGYRPAEEDLTIRADLYDDWATVEMLYVSANGKICGNCDASYETVDDFAEYDADSVHEALRRAVDGDDLDFVEEIA